MKWLLRILYRIVSPGHPRGWVDFYFEKRPGGLLIFCKGMERWNLPNIEMVDVPEDLSGFAHGILYDIIGYMKKQKPILSGENFEGMLVSDEQQALHQSTLYEVNNNTDNSLKMMRVVDMGQPAESGFPFRLMAVHLLELASQTSNLYKKEEMLRRSVEIYPGNPKKATLEEPVNNDQNFFSWEALGDVLCGIGKTAEGIKCLEAAVARCPKWAEDFKARLIKHLADGGAEEKDYVEMKRDPRFAFWFDVDVNKIREKSLYL